MKNNRDYRDGEVLGSHKHVCELALAVDTEANTARLATAQRHASHNRPPIEVYLGHVLTASQDATRDAVVVIGSPLEELSDQLEPLLDAALEGYLIAWDESRGNPVGEFGSQAAVEAWERIQALLVEVTWYDEDRMVFGANEIDENYTGPFVEFAQRVGYDENRVRAGIEREALKLELRKGCTFTGEAIDSWVEEVLNTQHDEDDEELEDA